MDEITQRTLDTLKPVLKETQLSKRALSKPPFPFLHKVLVELLQDQELFSYQQTQLSKLVSKESKAQFLTRVLAWVSFTLAAEEQQYGGFRYVNVLLLVSPVKMLAGYEPENTNELLFQVVQACHSTNRKSREKALEKVRSIGDPELYTFAVKVRSGLIRGQARIRGSIARKRLGISTNTPSIARPRVDEETKSGEDLVGVELFKEFEGYGVYKGIVTSYQNGKYTVYYPEDEDEEELEHEELVNQLKESARLQPHTKSPSRGSKDVVSYRGETPATPQPYLPVEDNQEERVDLDTTELSQQGKSWQDTIRSLLEQGRTNEEVEMSPEKATMVSKSGSTPAKVRHFKAPVPSLPKLHVPGGTDRWNKRLKNGGKSMETVPIEKNAVKSSPRHNLPAPAKIPDTRAEQPRKVTNLRSTQKRTTRFASRRSAPSNANKSNLSHSNESTKRLVLKVVSTIEGYLKRKHLRLVDLFRNIDLDGNGFISAEELIEVLTLMDFPVSLDEANTIMDAIDKDGNRMLDVEEFEQFLRIHRRALVRKEQRKQDLRSQVVSKKKPVFAALIKYKDRLCDLFKALDTYEENRVCSVQFRSAVGRLRLPDIQPESLNDLIEKCMGTPGTIEYEKLSQLLEVDGARKNAFLDENWLSHFDKKLDRVLKQNQ